MVSPLAFRGKCLFLSNVTRGEKRERERRGSNSIRALVASSFLNLTPCSTIASCSSPKSKAGPSWLLRHTKDLKFLMITNSTPPPPKKKERKKKTHIQHTWSLDEEMLHKGHGGDGDLKDLQSREITHQQLQFCDSPCKGFNSRPFSWSSSIKTNGCYIHILNHTQKQMNNSS